MATFLRNFTRNLFVKGLYKRNQGRMVRQGTGFAVALIFLVAAYQMQGWIQTFGSVLTSYTVSGLFFAFGAWFSYRLVNYPEFTDFLVSVEAEMNKVSWPTRQELIRSSVVVLVVLFLLAGLLFLFDVVWVYVIKIGNAILDFLFL